MLESARLLEVKEEGKIVQLSTHALSVKCGIVWSETVGDLAERVERGEYSDLMLQVNENAKKLMLVTISKEVGFGILVHPEAQAIEKGQCVSIYAGKRQYYPDDNYCLSGISAKKIGNMGRFFSHLPSNFELLAYEIDKSVNRDEIATANLVVKYLDDKKNIPALISVFEIKGGEVMGFTYGPDFWSARNIAPKLLSKSGKVIDDNLYSNQNPRRSKLYGMAESLILFLIEVMGTEEIQIDLMQCRSFEEVYQKVYYLIIEGYQSAVDEIQKNIFISLLTMYAGIKLEYYLSQFCDTEVFISEQLWEAEIKQFMDCLAKNEESDSLPLDQHTLEITINNLHKLLNSRVPKESKLEKMKPAIESVRNQLIEFQITCHLKAQVSVESKCVIL